MEETIHFQKIGFRNESFFESALSLSRVTLRTGAPNFLNRAQAQEAAQPNFFFRKENFY